MNTYTKTDVDTLLYTNYTSLSFIVDTCYSKTEIDPTLSGYTTSVQLHTGFYNKVKNKSDTLHTGCYSKVKTNLILDTYTTTTQLHYDFLKQRLC